MNEPSPLTIGVPTSEAPIDPSQPSLPSLEGLWAATGTLLMTYFFVQILVVIPVIGWWRGTQYIQNPDDIEALIFSEQGLWLTLIAAGLAAVLTVVVAVVWPRLWRMWNPESKLDFVQWFAWTPPQRIPLWIVPVSTLVLIFSASAIMYNSNINPEVEAQMALFSTPSLQIVATLIVSSIVPVAEELIFRGAMYNALLSRTAATFWGKHALAVIVTSLSFAAIHMLAGFETFASLLLISVFAVFLGLLRAVTGSTQATVVSHAVWNIIGSLALVASNNLPV